MKGVRRLPIKNQICRLLPLQMPTAGFNQCSSLWCQALFIGISQSVQVSMNFMGFMKKSDTHDGIAYMNIFIFNTVLRFCKI